MADRLTSAGQPLPREFFRREPHVVAGELLGAVIISTIGGHEVGIRLTEVEAYSGTEPAAHSFRGRTPRNAALFDEPGHLYAYFTYGMHYCANAVSHLPGDSGGVLLRGGEVVNGLGIAQQRRPRVTREHMLARGPACLAQCLGIDTIDFTGTDLCASHSPLQIHAGTPPHTILAGPRVGVARAADIPWRFWIGGERSVSPYKRHPKAAPPEQS